jgi:protein tyrosine phosphatase (PTP) superfamily phosphohydrolase (DUF442 family)
MGTTQRSQPPNGEDPVAAFCRELCTPLEIIANLLYVSTHEATPRLQAQEAAAFAQERLDDLRRLVLAHCRGNRSH